MSLSDVNSWESDAGHKPTARNYRYNKPRIPPETPIEKQNRATSTASQLATAWNFILRGNLGSGFVSIAVENNHFASAASGISPYKILLRVADPTSLNQVGEALSEIEGSPKAEPKTPLGMGLKKARDEVLGRLNSLVKLPIYLQIAGLPTPKGDSKYGPFVLRPLPTPNV